MSHIERLIHVLELETAAQEERYSPLNGNNYRQLKAEGILLQPIRVTRKSFGYADYPEISFTLPYPAETSAFKSGMSIQLILEGEEPVKGIILYLEGNKGEFRLFAPDFPDWLEEKHVGLQLVPDQRTMQAMIDAMKGIEQTPAHGKLFDLLHSSAERQDHEPVEISEFRNLRLNTSQQEAVKNGLVNAPIQIIHGPPGTGKTTTLIELIYQLVQRKQRVLISAPSNAATDHIGLQLASYGHGFLRVGNNVRIHEALLPYTIEGKMEDARLKSTIKQLRIRSEQLRKMAHQYKRNFGKEEREQRKLLLKEVKDIRKEIKSLQDHFESTCFEQASIILGTPIAIHDGHFGDGEFDVLIIDEAGQCLEPMAWTILPKAKRIVLAGDPFQLPPTVISQEAARKGLSVSILEQVMDKGHPTSFLDTQYRMTSAIAGYSNQYFYEGKLNTPEQADTQSASITFFDTAGAGYAEQMDDDTVSISNPEELQIIEQLVATENIAVEQSVLITPYSGQVQLAKERFNGHLRFERISTVDSFQGQEAANVIISLVRSNDEQQIGFLSDYRRMNVALTRAQKHLYIIGDSATIGTDPFFGGLLQYIEENGSYRSVFELMY